MKIMLGIIIALAVAAGTYFTLSEVSAHATEAIIYKIPNSGS